MIIIPPTARKVGRAVRTGENAVTTTLYEVGDMLYAAHTIPEGPDSPYVERYRYPQADDYLERLVKQVAHLAYKGQISERTGYLS